MKSVRMALLIHSAKKDFHKIDKEKLTTKKLKAPQITTTTSSNDSENSDDRSKCDFKNTSERWDDAMKDQSLGAGLRDEEEEHMEKEIKNRIVDEDLVVYHGKTYEKHCTYRSNDRKGNERLFSIVHFLLGKDSQEVNSAWVVEIFSFEKTLLETVERKGKLNYIQRGGFDKEIPLSELQEKVLDDRHFPECMYHERQTGRSALYTGLERISNRPKKVGQRDLVKTPLRGIDLYAGAGLMSSGFKNPDMDVVVSVEKDYDAVSSYASIHKAYEVDGVETLDSSLCKQVLEKQGRVAFRDTVEKFLQRCENDQSFRSALGKIDFVIMCSPCQGFSKENRGKQGNAEENNNESLRILKVAEVLRPDVIVFENVEGMWEREPIRKYLQEMVYGLFFSFGYNVKVGKLNSADFGDPQLRPRIFLVASSSNVGVPSFPRPTHGDGVSLLPYITAKEALSGEEEKFPENETLLNRDVYPKPDPNEPAKTVMASKSSAHYCKNRLYSLSENAILMGQDLDFVSMLDSKEQSESRKEKSKQRQIGNGVPRRLAKALARSVFDVLEWDWESTELSLKLPISNQEEANVADDETPEFPIDEEVNDASDEVPSDLTKDDMTKKAATLPGQTSSDNNRTKSTNKVVDLTDDEDTDEEMDIPTDDDDSVEIPSTPKRMKKGKSMV